MAAIGRFQKGDDIFFAKVVDGELFRVQGDVFGSPSFDKKPTKTKGLRLLTPVNPSKVIAVGLNYADHARESGKPLPKEPLFWLKAPTSLMPDGGKIEIPFAKHPAGAQLAQGPGGDGLQLTRRRFAGLVADLAQHRGGNNNHDRMEPRVRLR